MRISCLTIFSLFLLILMFGCGQKVDRSTLEADAYFEYAKKLYDKGKYYDAYTEFGIIALKFSGSPIVDDAQFYLAESYRGNKEYLIAMSEYQKLVDDYPQSPYVEEAFYKLGLSSQLLSQRAELDQQYTNAALRNYQNFIEAYPRSKFRKDAEKNMMELRTKLARKTYMGAQVYFRMGTFDSAVIYADILLERYYDTEYAEKALYLKAEALEKQKKYEDAITNYNAYINKYPDSKNIEKAKKRVAKIQEKLTDK